MISKVSPSGFIIIENNRFIDAFDPGNNNMRTLKPLKDWKRLISYLCTNNQIYLEKYL